MTATQPAEPSSRTCSPRQVLKAVINGGEPAVWIAVLSSTHRHHLELSHMIDGALMIPNLADGLPETLEELSSLNYEAWDSVLDSDAILTPEVASS